jgi:hypothetical protein
MGIGDAFLGGNRAKPKADHRSPFGVEVNNKGSITFTNRCFKGAHWHNFTFTFNNSVTLHKDDKTDWK